MSTRDQILNWTNHTERKGADLNIKSSLSASKADKAWRLPTLDVTIPACHFIQNLVS